MGLHSQPEMTTHINALGQVAPIPCIGGQPGPQNDHPYKGPWQPGRVQLYGLFFHVSEIDRGRQSEYGADV